MSANSEYLPPVQSPEDFESLCLDLWREIWGDPNAQKNGHSGQPQAGIDVFGRHGGRQVGIQCKQKDALAEKRLSAAVLREEVENAKSFKPPLDDFILATTAPRDAKIQEVARELSATVGFGVVVWAWEDIWHELYQRPALMARIKSVYWPLRAALGEQKIAVSRLPRAAAELYGRENELAGLEAAWQDPGVRVLSFVAWGGIGKTSVVAHWVASLAVRDYDGADYFDWSFYSQGTRDQSTASADAFVDAALRFFGDPVAAESSLGAWEKGARLAELVGQRRSLLVLDGLEPLQHPPGPLVGELKDPAIKALLRGLTTKNAGLCVLTTRVAVAELAHHRKASVREWQLERLSEKAGIALLESLGVQGSRAELAATVEEVDGHALTLDLLGRFLVRAHGGDVRKRDRVRLDSANSIHQGGHAFRVMEAYERWLEKEGAQGQRQVAILRLLGLFDRPANAGCLAALRKAPPIPGLTEALFERKSGWRSWFRQPSAIEEESWSVHLSLLAEAGLIEESEGAIDAHPLIREYFASQLRKSDAAWREAHGRLFDFLKESAEYRPDKLQGLQPLYQAVYHGCQAGRQQEALTVVYLDRTLRGTRGGGFHSTKMLGAHGADLGAVACFFETPWNQVSASLSEATQGWLLNQAALDLRALGRLKEAVEPMRASMLPNVEREDWIGASISANNLSQLRLTLGDVKMAVADAQESVDFADRSGELHQRSARRAALADARHQGGEGQTALVLFIEAERLQAEDQPDYPLLYSLMGFRYCDLLLSRVERAAGSGRDARAPDEEEECDAVEVRAAQTLEWATDIRFPLLDLALDQLTLGRVRLYRAILAGQASQVAAEAKTGIEEAVAGLRAAGVAHHLPRGLLTRSWLRFVTGDEEGARQDLDEAQEIAERGGMRLFLADIALYRARFFGDRAALAEARRLVEECGYGRRLPEIVDLEEKLGS